MTPRREDLPRLFLYLEGPEREKWPVIISTSLFSTGVILPGMFKAYNGDIQSLELHIMREV